MESIILRPNGVPVYGFLSMVNTRQSQDKTLKKRKILDCGAGGQVPPLALFHQHGFEGWGIDTSKEQLEKAREFCRKQGIELHLREGDMRRIPFDDGSFDYVYEHYSMCHLSKKDTALASSEMYRVLRQGGLCFLGFISVDTWPKSIFGKEERPGEYCGDEHGDEFTSHSLFTDQETDDLVSAWEIVLKQKQIRYLRKAAEETTISDWMELYGEAEGDPSEEEWQAGYERRADSFRYVHSYYYLRKP